MAGLVRRACRASLLDAHTYEEVEADRGAGGQAFAVVLASSLAAGVGAYDNGGPTGSAWVAAVGLAGWWVWAYSTYWIGTRLLPGPDTVADPGELLRTIGFSSAPGILRVLGLVPAVAGPVFLVATVWMLVAMVVAVRQALDYTSTARAVAVCAIGFPVYALFLVLTLLVLGPWPV